ncbi:hypothetical protein QYF36_009125 [Acer negundo]|nr:hypothetical protein QYF36_009125 [Acer negundo]
MFVCTAARFRSAAEEMGFGFGGRTEMVWKRQNGGGRNQLEVNEMEIAVAVAGFNLKPSGRVKDEFSVDCDDYGVTVIEANVACEMSELIKQPKIELLEQLRPFNEEEMLTTAQANMAVKVNYFDCGGVAICVSFRHVVVDASAAAYFVRNWAKVASGGSLIDIKDHVVFDCTSIFPSQDVSSLSKSKPDANDEDITKWFVFENSNIAVLQEKIGNRPTRFEALLALLWGAMIDAYAKEDDPTVQLGALIPVNLRRKLNPPLPEQCIGNAVTIGMTAWPTKERAEYNKIVFKFRELMSMVDEYIKNGFRNGWKTCIIDHAAMDRNSAMKVFNCSGTYTLPFYQTDFGWGKPVWFSAGQRSKNNNFVLLDTSDGKGIQVMVRLSKEDMAKFEQDPAILAYAS